MLVLIPSYQPTRRLAEVVGEIRAQGMDVLVVDDGSGPDYGPAFDAAVGAGAELLSYSGNRGKGRALKAGFAHVLATRGPTAVVTADSDGQHSARDIHRVAERLDGGSAIVLGSRRFAGTVPLRSRLGNAVSRRLFRLASGFGVRDTQTGLRGFPAETLAWLTGVRGERFEYELEVLLESRAAGIPVVEVDIETIYLERNASSHFRPIVDSARVMRPMLRFAASSLSAFVIDLIALQLLFWLTGSLILSVVAARLVSAGINFLINRHLVFTGGGSLWRASLRYGLLSLALLASGYLGLSALTGLGMPLLVAKPVTDVALYLVSFAAQRRLVFRRRARVGDQAGSAASRDRVATRSTAPSTSTAAQSSPTSGAASSTAVSSPSAVASAPAPIAVTAWKR